MAEPSFNWGRITLERTRSKEFNFDVYSGENSALPIGAGDIARFKISETQNGAPDLDIDSVAATANGSLCTITQYTAPGQVQVKFDQADVAALTEDDYYAELNIVDVSDSNRIKTVGRGCIRILGSQSGDIGAT
jgi:hypothetical protein